MLLKKKFFVGEVAVVFVEWAKIDGDEKGGGGINWEMKAGGGGWSSVFGCVVVVEVGGLTFGL